MSNFFIRRPIVAMVIAILTVIVGAVAIVSLPVAQFPNIVPPEIQLQASYVGADARTLEQSVATPIEQQINGVDNMNYMYSLNATANSQTTMVVDFDLKTDPNTDLTLTQSREQLAGGQLPPDVNTYGVTIKKSVTAPLMLVGLFSPNGTYDTTFLGNYAYINLNDPAPAIGPNWTDRHGNQLERDAVGQDQSPHQTVMDTGLVQRCLCVESRQAHG